ncbi:MAG: phytoene/squalene synthase family protein [Sphingomonadaceae bacterium]|uniref:phytoene/squalene synthase family protein n=1 Tax=Thermaurantiacus sp. TaxID=2820283 RepID=UPI00298F1409|nr:phytoene/squalene synthase family protein [Thermaurantiacus sp.]MCS6987698.1 phytoene/squalene synthase family protein [Sphingomonadaceae bacterium]MDW8415083.1 phytoene/squalene synthase family protein [Thermaurantiacus sp.]
MADPVLSAAREAIGKGSRSFALASRLFDSRTRVRATLLYAWCRHCDDVIDAQWLGQGRHDWGGTPAERLARLRRETERALAGEAGPEPAFAALARVARETGLPHRYAHDLLDGFAMDVEGRPIADEAGLLRYCYHVAGCVGVMMAIVMGVSPQEHGTLARASDLGLAFQLNNIARDVAEDAARGRCYLPAEWLAAEGLEPGRHMDPNRRDRLHRVVSRLVDLAERYEASALHGLPRLRNRQAWAVLSAAHIYGDIGRKVRRGGPEALCVRAVTRRREQLMAVLLAAPEAWWTRRRGASTPADRAGLWTPAFA